MSAKQEARKPKKERHSAGRVIKNVWYMFGYTFKYTPGYIWVTLVEAVGRAIYHIIGVLFLKYLFDAVENGVEFLTILWYIIAFAAYNALFELFNKWMLEVYLPRADLALHEGMQNELYEKARSLDQSCYDDPTFYNDFIWAIREADSRTARMQVDLSLFLNRIISTFAIFGVLMTMDWIVAVALLVLVTAGVLINLLLNKINYWQSLEMNPINRKLSYIGRIFYLPDHAKELRQREIAAHLRRQYAETTEEKIDCAMRYAKRTFGIALLSHLLSNVLPYSGVTAYLIVRYILDPALSLGDFSASMTATLKLFWMINDMGTYLTKFNEHSLYVEKVRTFLEYEPKITGEERGLEELRSLRLCNVSFSYPFAKDGERVLKGIDLEIRQGEKIAFVGYNGAGKTTLIKLLMRLYDPSEGQILYNGEDIRSYEPNAYRKHIGAVFQDYKVFAATVAENVMGGDYSDADRETVIEALRAASFADKLASIPAGLDAQLTREFSKDGVGLSGGESQKIAIARAFAHPYELIIMDEPSSALDPIAEYELNQSILQNAAEKTVIFISHRLSTTRMADRIYMFDGGQIVECGSHDELIARNGKYAEMWRVQAKNYRGCES
ncbi:MAG: ABC transporter ATP-binding protein [Clostridia bacterium]|nr:ABC transporter ATP-binding protein [Clostridia bacterium]